MQVSGIGFGSITAGTLVKGDVYVDKNNSGYIKRQEVLRVHQGTGRNANNIYVSHISVDAKGNPLGGVFRSIYGKKQRLNFDIKERVKRTKEELQRMLQMVFKMRGSSVKFGPIQKIGK